MIEYSQKEVENALREEFLKFQKEFKGDEERPRKSLNRAIEEDLIKMEIPQFDETNWPSSNDYAYIFPVNPNEEVKICYFEEN